jgi:hypothetical protein
MRISLILFAVLAAAIRSVSASEADDPFAMLAGKVLGLEEAAFFVGGDVRMSLSPERNAITVRVVNSREKTRRGEPEVEDAYTVEAHNRVVQTKSAPFMPTKASRQQLKNAEELSSAPEQFPEGTWNVTGVAERNDKFGPYMIKTDAEGSVDVYDKSGKRLGSYADRGYAIHSNTTDFSVSKSWGCVVVKAEDCKRIATTLTADRAQDAKTKQTFAVGKRK